MTRNTVQRDAILKVLHSTRCHPTAMWIYEQARQMTPGISLATVYRNLQTMRRDGMVMAIEQTGGETRFDGNPINHYHFRCDDCGNVFDIPEEVDFTIDERVARKTGCQVSYHITEFRGRCSACGKLPLANGTHSATA